MGHILSLLTYLLTTSVSGRVPGYPSYYPMGTRVINYPDTAALLSSRQQSKMWNYCCNVRPQRGQHCMRMRPRPYAMRLRPEILTSRRPRWPRWLNIRADRMAVARLLLLCTVSRLSVHGWHPLVASEWTRTRHNSCDVAADQAESCHLTWLSLLLFHCLLLLCNMCTSDSFITLSEVYYVCVCVCCTNSQSLQTVNCYQHDVWSASSTQTSNLPPNLPPGV